MTVQPDDDFKTPYGREAEISRITKAYERGRTRILSIVGPPGVGKSLLGRDRFGFIRDRSSKEGFAWSPNGLASSLDGAGAILADLFVQEASKAFEVGENLADEQGDDWVKGLRLGESVVERDGLLFLDGIDSQRGDPDGYDEFGHRGLTGLLQTVAGGEAKGLCIITTQTPFKQLKEEYPESVEEIELGPLDAGRGGELLRKLGVLGKEQDLAKTAAFYGGIPIVLQCLAGYLHTIGNHDVEAVNDIPGGAMTGVLTAFEQYFQTTSERSDDWDLIQCMGVYDFPAEVAPLRKIIAECGRTRDLPGGSGAETNWEDLIRRLNYQARLIEQGFRSDVIDAHQVVREFGAERFRAESPDDYRRAHALLGKYIESRASGYYKTDKLKWIAHMLTAMVQYCLAEDYDLAFKTYWGRIQQGEKRWATNQHGVVTPELLEQFFRRSKQGPLWDQPVGQIGKRPETVLLTESGYQLWHRGRNRESLVAFDAAAEANRRLWMRSCHDAATRGARRDQAESQRHAAEPAMVSGDCVKALVYAERAVRVAAMNLAEKHEPIDSQHHSYCLATQARVHHVLGDLEVAKSVYEEAAGAMPGKKLPYIFGAWYGELLAEVGDQVSLSQAREIATGICSVDKSDQSSLDFAYGHLVLALVDLRHGSWRSSEANLKKAVAYAQFSHQRPHLAYILLALADFRVLQTLIALQPNEGRSEFLLADADHVLKEAIGIIQPTPESKDVATLYMADYHIVSSRLAMVRGLLGQAREHLGQAAEIIERCKYGRKMAQLERLQTILAVFDPVSALVSDLKSGHEKLISLIETIYNRLVAAEQEKKSSRQPPNRDAVVPSLDQASHADVDLDSGRLRQISERIETALKPLVAEIRTISTEFPVEKPSEVIIARQVWSLVEQHVRGALAAEYEPKPEVKPLADEGPRRSNTPRQPNRDSVLPRTGHPLIEAFAKLWDERESLARPLFVKRFQRLVDRFHKQKNLGSYDLNAAATRWVSRLASKNSIKLMLNGEAVIVSCINRRESGFFLPRHGKGKSDAVKGGGSDEFPLLQALPL